MDALKIFHSPIFQWYWNLVVKEYDVYFPLRAKNLIVSYSLHVCHLSASALIFAYCMKEVSDESWEMHYSMSIKMSNTNFSPPFLFNTVSVFLFPFIALVFDPPSLEVSHGQLPVPCLLEINHFKQHIQSFKSYSSIWEIKMQHLSLWTQVT